MPYPTALEQLVILKSDALDWEYGPVNVEIATSSSNDTERTINLIATFGHNKLVSIREKRDDSNCFWLSSQLNENSQLFRANMFIQCLSKHAGIPGFCS